MVTLAEIRLVYATRPIIPRTLSSLSELLRKPLSENPHCTFTCKGDSLITSFLVSSASTSETCTAASKQVCSGSSNSYSKITSEMVSEGQNPKYIFFCTWCLHPSIANTVFNLSTSNLTAMALLSNPSSSWHCWSACA